MATRTCQPQLFSASQFQSTRNDTSNSLFPHQNSTIRLPPHIQKQNQAHVSHSIYLHSANNCCRPFLHFFPRLSVQRAYLCLLATKARDTTKLSPRRTSSATTRPLVLQRTLNTDDNQHLLNSSHFTTFNYTLTASPCAETPPRPSPLYFNVPCFNHWHLRGERGTYSASSKTRHIHLDKAPLINSKRTRRSGGNRRYFCKVPFHHQVQISPVYRVS